MASPSPATQRRVTAIVDRHTRAKEAILAQLIKAILRILAELFAEEARALSIPATRPMPAAQVHSETGKPVMAPSPAAIAERDLSTEPPRASNTPAEVEPAPRPTRPVRPLAQLAAQRERAEKAARAGKVEVISKAEVYTPERMEARRKAARRIAVVVRVAETSTANLVQAQNDAIARELGRTTKSPASGYTGERARKVDPEAEWLRPVYDFLESAREGRTLDESAQLAAERVEIQAEDDLNVATRAGMADWMERNLGIVTGYRRVVHPELSEGGSCGMCLTAATRVYKVNRLHPLHARCKCGVVPIFNGKTGDIGQAMNFTDIDAFVGRMYGDAGGSTAREDLLKTRYTVAEHSELGPQFVEAPRASSRQKKASEISDRGAMANNPTLRRRRRTRTRPS